MAGVHTNQSDRTAVSTTTILSGGRPARVSSLRGSASARHDGVTRIKWGFAVTDIARQLRAQKRYSTDPRYLERMALEEEFRNGLNLPRVGSKQMDAPDVRQPGSQERL